MAIDDVQYLVENSVEDSVQLFIDSSNRNYEFYPEPNEYVVHFDEPIKNVFGINILDAAIPSSMFNIEHFNNQFKILTFLSKTKGYVEGTKITPNAQGVVEEVGSIPRLREYLDLECPTLVALKYEHYVQALQAGYSPAMYQGDDEFPRPLKAPASLLVRHHDQVRMLKDVEGFRKDPNFRIVVIHNKEDAIPIEEPILAVIDDPAAMYVLAGKVPGTASQFIISWYSVVSLADKHGEVDAFLDAGHDYLTVIFRQQTTASRSSCLACPTCLATKALRLRVRGSLSQRRRSG